MSRHQRTLIGLYLSLAACVAGGFWVHARYVFSIARSNSASAARVADVQDVIGALPIAGLIAFLLTWPLSCVLLTTVLGRIHRSNEERKQQEERNSFLKTQELIRTRDCIIFGLAKLAESRDQDTGNHLERISLYSTQLATALRRNPAFRDQIDAQFIRNIGISSALHDIGKVGVADSILLKPGKLTDAERTEMQQHTLLGSDCILAIERRLGSSNFLQMAREIALYHHERWDGTGYPFGLAEYEIPLSARIVALADVYDALSMRRVYKPALPHEECMRIITSDSGQHFDPAVVKVFLEIAPQFREISSKFVDRCSSEAPGAHSWPQPSKITAEQEAALLEAIQLNEGSLEPCS